MNTKIVAALALFPFFIITYFAFISQPSWINYYAVVIFIPCIFLGFALNPTHSQQVQVVADSDHQP